MARIDKKAVVKFSANQMFTLVNDIEAYPSFLPWCTDAFITNHSYNELVASVSISIGRIKKIFKTQNTMQQGSSISMKLIKGPFKILNGEWNFENNQGTYIHFYHRISDMLIKTLARTSDSGDLNTQ